MVTKKIRNGGFTLLEVLLTVAIVVILLAFSIVGIAQYRDHLKLTELDNAARDIYMAAENRAVLLQNSGAASGTLATLSANTSGSGGPVRVLPSTASATLDKLLPEGVIDPALRDGCFYILYDDETRHVVEVFYAEGAFALTDENLPTLRADRSTRVSAFRNKTNGIERLVGYYGIDKIILGPDEKSGIERRNRLHIASVAIILVIILAFIAWTITIGSVDADLEDDRVSIDATMMHEDVLYDSITYVELRDDVSYGTKVGGLNNSKVLTGNFRNDEFGMYRLAVYNDVNQCIVIHTTEKTVVFNLDSDGKTRDMYNNLSDVLENPTAMHSTAMVPVAC